MTDESAEISVEAFLFGKLAIAQSLTELCDNDERTERMCRAVDRFSNDLGLKQPEGAVGELQRRSLGWGSLERRILLVDLWAAQPFAPYEISVTKAHLRHALTDLATALDAPGAIGDIERSVRELRNAKWLKVAGKAGGALAVGAISLGSGAFIAAPFIGTALGASAGLSGAAATSTGLALLGGGSLAAGGSGVAGGVLFVTAGGAAAGGLLGGGGSVLYQLGGHQAQYELRKMEIKFKVALLQTQAELGVAQNVSKRLHDEIGSIQAALDEERLYSEKRSQAIKRMEKLLGQLEEVQGWMDADLADARS